MKENENARQNVSSDTNCKENQAGSIIDAEALYKNSVSGLLKDSVVSRSLIATPSNEDRIRGVA